MPHNLERLCRSRAGQLHGQQQLPRRRSSSGPERRVFFPTISTHLLLTLLLAASGWRIAAPESPPLANPKALARAPHYQYKAHQSPAAYGSHHFKRTKTAGPESRWRSRLQSELLLRSQLRGAPDPAAVAPVSTGPGPASASGARASKLQANRADASGGGLSLSSRSSSQGASTGAGSGVASRAAAAGRSGGVRWHRALAQVQALPQQRQQQQSQPQHPGPEQSGQRAIGGTSNARSGPASTGDISALAIAAFAAVAANKRHAEAAPGPDVAASRRTSRQPLQRRNRPPLFVHPHEPMQSLCEQLQQQQEQEQLGLFVQAHVRAAGMAVGTGARGGGWGGGITFPRVGPEPHSWQSLIDLNHTQTRPPPPFRRLHQSSARPQPQSLPTPPPLPPNVNSLLSSLPPSGITLSDIIAPLGIDLGTLGALPLPSVPPQAQPPVATAGGTGGRTVPVPPKLPAAPALQSPSAAGSASLSVSAPKISLELIIPGSGSGGSIHGGAASKSGSASSAISGARSVAPGASSAASPSPGTVKLSDLFGSPPSG